MNNEIKRETAFPGDLSPEEMKEIFESTVLYLINKRYNFSIINGQGSLNYIQLECPDLMMKLSLSMHSLLSRNELRCLFNDEAGGYHAFEVNDFIQMIEEIRKKENELKSKNSAKKR